MKFLFLSATTLVSLSALADSAQVIDETLNTESTTTYRVTLLYYSTAPATPPVARAKCTIIADVKLNTLTTRNDNGFGFSQSDLTRSSINTDQSYCGHRGGL